MNAISYSQVSPTFCTVVIAAGLLASQTVPSSFEHVTGLGDNRLFPNSYRTNTNGSTYGQYANFFTGEYNTIFDRFEQVVGRFYARLLENQEPLGMEFESVLHENLWDLYES
jgi:hypothetical protein